MKQAKLGHRKSHSFAGIQVEMKQEAPVCSDNADAIENWVHGGMKSRSIGPEFHFFSDTEVEVRSPTRPSTPIHSDTEYEVLHFTLTRYRVPRLFFQVEYLPVFLVFQSCTFLSVSVSVFVIVFFFFN